MPATTRRYASQIMIWVLLTAALMGCTSTPAVQPINAATETSVLATPLTTFPAPSRTPSPTLTPTIAPSPTPDMPLSESGPWLVFLAATEKNGDEFLWATNPDGTGLTKLSSDPILGYTISPQNNRDVRIAYTTGTANIMPESFYCYYTNLTLKIVRISDGGLEAVIPLTSNLTTYSTTTKPIEGVNITAINDAVSNSSPAWSPGGSLLAFAAAIDGQTSDVYVYNPKTQSIRQLENGPDQADWVGWSPDGRYVIHTAHVSGIDYEGGMPTAGIWATRIDGAETTPLFEPYGDAQWLSNFEDIYVWPTFDTVIVGSFNWSGSDNNIRVVDLTTGSISYIIKDNYMSIAYDSRNNIWLYALEDPTTAETTLVMLKNGSRQALEGPPISNVWWDGNRFWGSERFGSVYTITLGGEFSQIEAPEQLQQAVTFVNVSPDGQYYYATANVIPEDPQPGLWFWKPGGEPILVIEEIIKYSCWSPDKTELLLMTENRLYRISPPSFEPVALIEGLYFSGYFQWIPSR